MGYVLYRRAESDETFGSWLRLGPALAVTAIWSVNQQVEDLRLSVYLTSLSVTLKILKKKKGGGNGRV